MTTSYVDDTDDRHTHVLKGLAESYMDETTHAYMWVMWGPLTFKHHCAQGPVCTCSPLEL